MADHRAQEAKGRAKEAVGNLTDRDDLVRKGRADRSKADVKRTAGDLKHRIRDTANKLRDRISGAGDRDRTGPDEHRRQT
jgi:uncharacterized protein YjbJ (UPF0337 family)